MDHPDEVVNMLGLQAIWSLLYDEQDVYTLNMPNTQVVVNAMAKEDSFMLVPHIALLLQNGRIIQKTIKFDILVFPHDSYRH